MPLVMALFVSTLLIPLLDILTERPARCCRRCALCVYRAASLPCEAPGSSTLRPLRRIWFRHSCGFFLRLEEKYPNCCCRVLTSCLTLRLPTALGLALVIAAVLAVVSGVGYMLEKSVHNFAEELPYYEVWWPALYHALQTPSLAQLYCAPLPPTGRCWIILLYPHDLPCTVRHAHTVCT